MLASVGPPDLALAAVVGSGPALGREGDGTCRAFAMDMATRDPSVAVPPPGASLRGLARAAAGCTACPLHLTGTQTVFGSGPRHAPLMLVGEQPGDAEDRVGEPFVGPAGKVLREVLAEVGLGADAAYVTNAVKHFKWERRGKRRLHAKPSSREMEACRPWLMAEIDRVRPRILVCLGATAARVLLGPKFRLTEQRGRPVKSELAPYVVATVHPSSLLRIPDREARHLAREELRADLARIASLLRRTAGDEARA